MSRIQARIQIPAPLAAAIEPLRLKWNPEQAAGNPAHTTITYHDEAPDESLLGSRLREALRNIAPFPLELGSAEQFPPPDRGAFLRVTDPTASVAAIASRCCALRSPRGRGSGCTPRFCTRGTESDSNTPGPSSEQRPRSADLWLRKCSSSAPTNNPASASRSWVAHPAPPSDRAAHPPAAMPEARPPHRSPTHRGASESGCASRGVSFKRCRM